MFLIRLTTESVVSTLYLQVTALDARSIEPAVDVTMTVLTADVGSFWDPMAHLQANLIRLLLYTFLPCRKIISIWRVCHQIRPLTSPHTHLAPPLGLFDGGNPSKVTKRRGPKVVQPPHAPSQLSMAAPPFSRLARLLMSTIPFLAFLIDWLARVLTQIFWRWLPTHLCQQDVLLRLSFAFDFVYFLKGCCQSIRSFRVFFFLFFTFVKFDLFDSPRVFFTNDALASLATLIRPIFLLLLSSFSSSFFFQAIE